MGPTKAITRTTPVESLPQFLTVEEFATYLAIGRTLAYELVRTGQVESVRYGKLVRIPRSALVREDAPLLNGGRVAR